MSYFFLGEDPAICPSPNLFVMFEENLVENQMMEKEDNDDVDQNEVYSSDDNDSQSEVDDESEEDDEANIHQGYSKSSSAPSNVGCDSHGDKINTNQNQDGKVIPFCVTRKFESNFLI